MLNKIKALVNNKGIDVNDITEIQNNQLFIVGNEEYYVLTDEEAQEIYEDIQRDLINDMGLEGFSSWAKEEIINNYLNMNWFNSALDEYNTMYVYELEEYELQEMCDMYEVDNEVDLIESLNNQYDNGLQFFQEMYNERELSEIIERENLLDIDKVIAYCQEIDGRGGTITSYDGVEEVEEVDNIEYYIYRIN
jgi:hypothetical protein